MTKEKITDNGLNRELGQFFSPKILVDKCISLIKNKGGRLLEPSCGNGAFNPAKSDDSVFIEIDKNVVSSDDVLVMDFFDYPESEKFDTIIGNPPYVDNSLITVKHRTGIKVQANLYLYFIEKCFYHLREDGGELIFIVPREFIKLTSARYVNNLLYENGTITEYYDYGDEKLFDESCPNVCIFRYERGNMSHKTKTFDGELTMVDNDGLISFVSEDERDTIGDFFEIKVGAVSGADKCFESPEGIEFVYSKTKKTGGLKRMIYQENHPALLPYKDVLINRGIKHFSEEDWFMWGRAVDFRPDKPRIYVNCKTRNRDPFFTNECERWDGSLLALFPKVDMDLDKAVKTLNSLDWNRMGFMTGGRYLFAQKSLKEAPVNGKLFG